MTGTAGLAVDRRPVRPFTTRAKPREGRRFTVETITHRARVALRTLRAASASASPSDPGADTVHDLVRRVEHLEAALEGLQDAVYRQDVLHDRQIADLRKRRATRPNAGSPGLRGERP